MLLSDLKIRKAKQRDKAYRLSDGLGLYLQVQTTGSKLWHFRYQYMGKEKLLSIGQYPAISLAEARGKRDEAKKLLAGGTDPSIQKKLDMIDAEVKGRMTFKEIAEEYYQTLVDRELAPATLRKKRWHIDDLARPIHNRPIDQITAAELLHLLKPIERSGRRETAKKLRATISAVFRLAMVTMRASADPSAVLKDALLPPKVKGRSAITDEPKFGQLLRDLDAFTGAPVIRDAMLFQILTCTRPGETRGAKKPEIDLENRSWTIPPERMKMRREHKIPLSRQAYALVNRPEVFRKLNQTVKLPASVVEDAFIKANPDWQRNMLTITCKDSHIQEARLCLSRDLMPVPCGQDVINDCRAKNAVFAPIR